MWLFVVLVFLTSFQKHSSASSADKDHFSTRRSATKDTESNSLSPSTTSSLLSSLKTIIISVDDGWSNTVAISKTTATLQVVSNPILNSQTSPVAPKLFQALSDLQADLVRYVPWFPYPHVAVAELEPPNATTQTTSWNFSGIQQQLYDVYDAVTGGNTTTTPRGRVVINFSTQPTWMFNTTNWDYPDGINQVDWSYPRGKMIQTPPSKTTKLVAQYYGRLASWLIHGQFKDEFKHLITGGPAYGTKRITHWEIFNEPEAEHDLTIDEYNQLYDAIVQKIRLQADRNHRITFIGMGLLRHDRWDWWEGFLTPNNHKTQIARDAVANGMASFHFYGKVPSRTNVTAFSETFDQIPQFLKNVDQIIDIRNRLSPTTGLAYNEAGVIPPNDNDIHAPPSPPIYYNMVAGFFTILWSELSVKGIDIVGSSQFCGCPAIPEWDIPNRQYPGVSMTNWTTGSGNPRYWALKLMIEIFGPGDAIIESSTTTSFNMIEDDDDDNKYNSRSFDKSGATDVYSQARVTAKTHQLALILVNKSHEARTVILSSSDNNINKNDGWKGALVHTVDETTHDGPWKSYTVNDCSDLMKVVLAPFAVTVVLAAAASPEGATGTSVTTTQVAAGSRIN